MIPANVFFDCLKRHGIEFFAGVPDSLLKDFCAYISDNADERHNIIAANEGNALAIASGYHLATQNVAMVYMQNSGLGNAVNPLTSLADKEVYSIPILLLIGWRAEPNVKDEPQHVKMGKITTKLLDTLGIPYSILDDTFEEQIKKAAIYLRDNKAPYALVARKDSFEKYESKNKKHPTHEMSREEAIQSIAELLGKDDIVISTTGMISRELFEFRESRKQGHEKDFMTVGSMGHSSSIALAIALNKPSCSVYCFDGDGALIMHMGALPIIGQLKPKNFKHIIFNNFSHDSVGGQPTAASNLDIPSIARACGYTHTFSADTKRKLTETFHKIKSMEGPILLEIKVNKGHRKDLGRPTRTPAENKEDFMKFLENI